jgi:hypothetical protein
MRGKIRTSYESGQDKDMYADLYGIFQDDVQLKWSRERQEFTPSLGNKYAGLFKYSEELIRSLIQYDMKEVKTEIDREQESEASVTPESRERKMQSPAQKMPPASQRKSEKNSGTCEERVEECQKELEQLKGILKQLRKGMI